MNEEKHRLRSILLSKHFNEKYVLSLYPDIDAGATADEILEALRKFGEITSKNKDDALLNVHPELLKGKLVTN